MRVQNKNENPDWHWLSCRVGFYPTNPELFEIGGTPPYNLYSRVGVLLGVMKIPAFLSRFRPCSAGQALMIGPEAACPKQGGTKMGSVTSDRNHLFSSPHQF